MTDVYVLYHSGCYDGFGAAWVVHRKFWDKAEYIPMRYGDPLPEIPDGSLVYMLDWSAPRDVLTMLADCCQLKVIDHHATAQEGLIGLPFAHFDLAHSGAVLAWQHFFPDNPVPELLQYIEDRDLWRWKLTYSREVSAALQSYPMNFAVWDELILSGQRGVDQLAKRGEGILAFKEQQVAQICDQSHLSSLQSFRVPVANATAFWSEVGEELLRRYPDALFSLSYFDRADGKRQWSLRSRPDFDCSKVAQFYGGGGHPSAAGFTTKAPEVL